MTEEKAKTKWCPFARVGVDKYITANRESSLGEEANCIASDCMVWRWLREGEGYCGLAGSIHIK